jgi:hypothetical protein
VILPLRDNAYAAELMSVLDVLVTVLDQLALCRDGALDERALLAAAPQARWLLERRRRQVDALLLNTTQAERRALAAAVANDRRFDTSFGSPEFSLRYPGLSAHVRSYSRALLGAFYEILLRRGFEVTREDGTTIVIDRRTLERGFFERNPGLRACPACLEAEIAPAGDGLPTAIDCDHYLPRSIYGSLAIHPQNLVFTCIPCNQRRKGQSDPLAPGGGRPDVRTRRRTGAGALRSSYLPYRRPALGEMQIEFARGSVKLGADTQAARERVASFDRVFKLAGVWSDVLPRAEREMFEELRGLPTRGSVKAVLDNVEAHGQGAPERLKHGVFLRSRYATHLRERHLDTLTREWQRKSRELRRSAAIYADGGHLT